MDDKAVLEITIPVYNEEKELEKNIEKLLAFCQKNLDSYKWQITIADNASTDKTPRIGKKLAEIHPQIAYLKLEKKGRGRAVKQVWLAKKADISCYMDLDLSTDLKHLPDLVASLAQGYDIAIGSRLLKDSKVVMRSLKRELISKIYNLIIKFFFQTKFSDAQCGFKAIRKDVIANLIPYIKDNGWFMDSEMLILAEKLGYKVGEVPVVWRDNPGSTVRILPTAYGDLIGILRLFFVQPWKKLPSKNNDLL